MGVSAGVSGGAGVAVGEEATVGVGGSVLEQPTSRHATTIAATKRAPIVASVQR